METITIISTTAGLVLAMGVYLHKDIRRVEDKIGSRIDGVESRLDTSISKLDDRVYALATGLKPLVDEVSERHHTQ